jgi:hypothetical protein
VEVAKQPSSFEKIHQVIMALARPNGQQPNDDNGSPPVGSGYVGQSAGQNRKVPNGLMLSMGGGGGLVCRGGLKKQEAKP